MRSFSNLTGSLPALPGWMPDWLWSALVLMAAAILATLAHRLSLWILDRVMPPKRRRGFLQTFVTATTGPTRLATIVFSLGAALNFAAFPDLTSSVIAHLLLVAFIVLVGWSAMRAFEIAATLYLNRFRTDVADNLMARKHLTQVRILKRAADILIVVVTAGAALMTVSAVRQYGISLFASAGAASLVVGLAARPLLTNLIAGMQIAITQPIRLEDAVIVEGEWGWIEEITSTYVVVRLWDWRRMVLPIAYFLEHPFQNWTRETASLIGSVFLHLDYRVPVEAVRRELAAIAAASPLWDGRVVSLQVSDAGEQTIELRALVSARDAPQSWDLRCEVREKLIAWLQQTHPEALSRRRVEVTQAGGTPGGPALADPALIHPALTEAAPCQNHQR